MSQIFLDGCFMRSENYSFFDEYAGPGDKAVCGNKTRTNSSFQAAAKQAILEVVQAAPNSIGCYTRGKVDVSRRVNESAYVLANCWKSLNSSLVKYVLRILMKIADFGLGPPLAGRYDMGALCMHEHSEKLCAGHVHLFCATFK
ncbi:hypothetical protein AHAS_Ahas11G0180700 [Arachis hypogaea]